MSAGPNLCAFSQKDIRRDRGMKIEFRPSQQRWNNDVSHDMITKTASENPLLWTGTKGASAESRKNESDAETSSA
jgi:hypothetical protein